MLILLLWLVSLIVMYILPFIWLSSISIRILERYSKRTKRSGKPPKTQLISGIYFGILALAGIVIPIMAKLFPYGEPLGAYSFWVLLVVISRFCLPGEFIKDPPPKSKSEN